MKTKQIYYIAALAMLTACTNNEEYETVTNNGLQKVTFADPFVGKKLTRAESGDIDNNTLQNFSVKVWGQNIGKHPSDPDVKKNYTDQSAEGDKAPFSTGDVIKHTASGWTCDNEYYYPRDKYYFRFAAFAPAEAIHDASSNSNGVVLNMTDNSLTFSGDDANSYGITNIPLVQTINNGDTKEGWDLLVSNRFLSKPTNGVENRDAISFTFQHILSRLSFYVYTTNKDNANNGNYTVKVKNIKVYLPKTDGTSAKYRQNTNTDKPTAETQQYDKNNYNSTNSSWKISTNDTWAWEGFEDVTNVTTPTDFTNYITTNIGTSNKYKEFEVFTSTDGQTVEYKEDFKAAAITESTKLANNIGKEYFLAPTPVCKNPSYSEGGTEPEGSEDKYHFFVTVDYTITETVSGESSTTVSKDYHSVLNLYDSEFYRFKQGWHHKLYINLSNKTIRFISASVDNWENTEHKEDMTVSREVEGWTAEQN